MNKTRIGIVCLNFLIITSISGCATQPMLTQEQIMSQYEQVSRLQAGLREAEVNGSESLAPTGYEAVSKSLEKAMEAARNNKTDAVNQATAEGINLLDKVKSDTRVSKNLLSEVLTVRKRAEKAGAPLLNATEYGRLEKDLQEVASLIEKGQLEKAKQRRPELIDGYSKLELAALKLGMVDVAKIAIEEAKKNGAEKYAPKTLGQAQEEVNLALSILDADRTQTEKADIHSKKAKWLADQSAAITEIIKDYKRRDYTQEDIVLWYEDQLAYINQPLGAGLPFNEENARVIGAMQQAISKVVEERNMAKVDVANIKAEMDRRLAMSDSEASQKLAQAENKLKAAEAQITELMNASQQGRDILRQEYEQKLALSSREREDMAAAERAQKARFEKVQSLFDSEEATVYQQRQNVLISVHGFKFPSGQSEINAENFPLMNKIIQSINIFPGSHIEVDGHTDSTGNDETNQLLSQQRAEKVAKFLEEVGNISGERITARGFGESKPVASNETPEGRASNRRVEIVIINEE